MSAFGGKMDIGQIIILKCGRRLRQDDELWKTTRRLTARQQRVALVRKAAGDAS
jgi:hypothetical protein